MKQAQLDNLYFSPVHKKRIGVEIARQFKQDKEKVFVLLKIAEHHPSVARMVQLSVIIFLLLLFVAFLFYIKGWPWLIASLFLWVLACLKLIKLFNQANQIKDQMLLEIQKNRKFWQVAIIQLRAVIEQHGGEWDLFIWKNLERELTSGH